MNTKDELSQNEVDALLYGINGEADDTQAPVLQSSKAPISYKLGTDERIVRNRMTTLEAINERFARDLRYSLMSFMHRSADISVGSVQIQKYSDFIKNLPVPANINLVQMKPLRGAALFVFEPKLVFLEVDNLFGSDGRYPMRVEGRNFTPTEQRIIKRLLNLTLENYDKAWRPVYPIDFEYMRSEVHIKQASIVAPNEVVLSTTFRIDFGQIGGSLTICLPYSMVQPIRDLLANPLLADVEIDNRWIEQLSQQITSADVELVVNFLTIDSTIGQLVKLKIGDVLPVEIPASVVASINGIPVLECSYGTSGNHYALRVQKMLNHQHTDLNTGKDHERK